MSQKIAALCLRLGGCLGFMLPASGFAQDSTVAEGSSPTHSVQASEDISAVDEPSHFAIEVGLGLRKVPGPELRLTWIKDDDLVLGLKLSQFQAQDISGFDDLTLTSMALVTRFTVEESFFFEGGVDFTQRKATIDSPNLSSDAGNGSYSYQGSVQQTYMVLSVGNQWQSGMWTFGADWLDLYLPFSSSIKSSSSGTVGDLVSRERRDERSLKTEAWTINYGVSIHGGLSF